MVKRTGVARRLRKTAGEDSAHGTMETVVCGKCGQRFVIHPDLGVQDIQIARKHAAWVLDRLLWDHIQERKHPGTMDLPIPTVEKPA